MGSPDRDMAQAGARFESYVREAMTEASIPSLAELARRSGIAASAWHGWFRGDRQPRLNSLKLAAEPLDRTPEQLAAVWEGERPRKARPVVFDPYEVLAAHAEAMVAQTRAFERLAASIDAAADRVTRRVEDAAVTAADALALLRAEQSRTEDEGRASTGHGR